MTRLETLDKMIEVHQKKINNWNCHFEWKLIEYDNENQHGLIVKEYDVVEDKVLLDNLVSQPAKLES